MSERVTIVVGSFVLAMAPVFVAAHYYREQMRWKRLRQLEAVATGRTGGTPAIELLRSLRCYCGT